MKIKRISFMRIDSRFRDGELGEVQDMLRYDVAFQWTKDPHIVAFPVFHTKDGNLGGRVNYSRWNSYSVRIQPNMESDDSPSMHNIHLDDWITYRHPHIKDGPHDYGQLIPVSLREFSNIVDSNDVDLVAYCSICGCYHPVNQWNVTNQWSDHTTKIHSTKFRQV